MNSQSVGIRTKTSKAASSRRSPKTALWLRLQSHAPQQVGEARVAAQGLEWWFQSDSRQLATASLKILRQPGKSLILISQTRVNCRDVLRECFMLLIFSLNLFEYRERVGALPRNRVGVSEMAKKLPLSSRELNCLLKLCDGL